MTEKTLAEKMAETRWNATADEFNQWETLSADEKSSETEAMRTVRDAVIEECAKVCDALEEIARNSGQSHKDGGQRIMADRRFDQADGLMHAATAIRHLKDTPCPSE